MLERDMFCYQCEQTARGSGCVALGMCGKDSAVSGLQDLLVYQLEGLSFHADRLVKSGTEPCDELASFVIESIFATLTNVNFDAQWFIDMLKRSQTYKERQDGS